MKFGMFNYTSKNVKPQDLSRTAKTTLGNGVRETILSPNYVAFPDEAMTRFAQERGLLQHKDIVRIPKPVVVCQGVVRQATTLPGSTIQAMSTNVPTEEWMKKELVELAKLQRKERELSAEPTTLVGAVQELNKKNDGRQTTVQQRLKIKGAAALDDLDSSVEFVAEVKGNPERERKPVVRLTPPVVDEVVMPVRQVVEPADTPVDVLDMGYDSDDPDRDRIILQRLKVKLEMDRLAKYEVEYALKMENRRRRR